MQVIYTAKQFLWTHKYLLTPMSINKKKKTTWAPKNPDNHTTVRFIQNVWLVCPTTPRDLHMEKTHYRCFQQHLLCKHCLPKWTWVVWNVEYLYQFYYSQVRLVYQQKQSICFWAQFVSGTNSLTTTQTGSNMNNLKMASYPICSFDLVFA